MAIKFRKVGVDDQNLPVVSWEEHRNMFAPGHGGREIVSCFIRPDEESGELQFVAVGTVRHGQPVESRPWQKLTDFRLAQAEDLYVSVQDKVLKEEVGRKYPAVRALLTDGAHAIVAVCEQPGGKETPMHLNCADAPAAQAHELLTLLQREFFDQRDEALRRAKLKGEYVWPKDRPFVAYTPGKLEPLPWWYPLVEYGPPILLVALVCGVFYWLLNQ